MWRLKTVPPVAFNQERQNLIEGGLDVQGGDVPASSQGLLCRRDERSRGCAGIRTAPGHGAQDAQVLGTSRIVEYDQRWPALYEEEKAIVVAATGIVAKRVEHIAALPFRDSGQSRSST